MCGIFGFVSKKPVTGIGNMLQALKKLEYRGYDSTGIAVVTQKGIYSQKKAGRISKLEPFLDKKVLGSVFIGHTRWATHGKPSDKNAHPHFGCDNKIQIVHNGIIENYKSLKHELEGRGHRFKSDTDSEVFAHLVEEFLGRKNGSEIRYFEEAVRLSLKRIKGAYAFAVIHQNYPKVIIVAKNSSPLLIGLSDQAKYIASDPIALLRHTRKVIYLNDQELAIVTPDQLKISTLQNKEILRKYQEVSWSEDAVRKTGFTHFMEKEIFEEPEAVENAIRGRLIVSQGLAKLGGLESVRQKLESVKRLIITACGTAFFSGLVGEYMLEEFAGLPVEVESGSELRYKRSPFDDKSALLAVSQSGETADTLGSIKEIKKTGLLTLGLVNTVGSSIARETNAGVYNHAGPEISVASTKVFISQLAVFALLTLFLGRQRSMSKNMGKLIASELTLIPRKLRTILESSVYIKRVARKYFKYNNFLFLGRKFNYPIALEGALKLKEVSYIHAEGYGAGDMKHGPLALIDENFPSIVIAPKDSVYDKVVSNMEELKARKGKIIIITTSGNKGLDKLADEVLYIPKTIEMLTPLLTVMPLHLLAYYMGVFRGHDVDKPRNLAKSVTVE
ncbi:MAG: glutamine--fructose-6-phosphate transaminase (isomerizing) [Parcubacteria group bacterium]|nr:glutamine--fructose-6-phosphate transaminase (isomerizing) [Parcubacteria group bacterium]